MKICCWFHSIHLWFHRFANPTSLLQLLFCVALGVQTICFTQKCEKRFYEPFLKSLQSCLTWRKRDDPKIVSFLELVNSFKPQANYIGWPARRGNFFHANSKRIINGFFDSFSTNLCQPHSETLCLLRWERLNQPQEVHWVTTLVLHFSNSLSHFQAVTICHSFIVSFHPLLSLLHLHFLCKVSQDSLTIVLS